MKSTRRPPHLFVVFLAALAWLLIGLGGCGLSRGQIFAIGLNVGQGIADTSIVAMTDEDLAKHRTLVAEVVGPTCDVCNALTAHLAVVDAEIASRAASGSASVPRALLLAVRAAP